MPEKNRLQVRLKPGEYVELPPFVFVPANESVSGIVVDRQGKPVAGAEFTAWTGPDPSEDDVISTARAKATGADGRFTVPGLPKMPVVLQVGFMVPDASANGNTRDPPHTPVFSRDRRTFASRSIRNP